MKLQNFLALLVIFSFVFILSVSSVKAFTVWDLFNYVSSILAQYPINGIQGAAVLTSGCSGTPTSCSSFSGSDSCSAQTGCSWVCTAFNDNLNRCTAYACQGTHTACSSLTSQASCTSQTGCSWIVATTTTTHPSTTTTTHSSTTTTTSSQTTTTTIPTTSSTTTTATSAVPPSDFRLYNSGSNTNLGGIAVMPGSSGSITIYVTLVSTPAKTVTLSAPSLASGLPLPSGVTYSFSSVSGLPSFNSIMTVNVASYTQPGYYTIEVVGTSPDYARQTLFTLQVLSSSKTSTIAATTTSSSAISSSTTSTTTTMSPPTQYAVCTYVNPRNIGASFYLNGIPVYDGQVIKITPGAAYTIAANTPSGYSFSYWNTARTVFPTNSYLANTTVYFNTTGWDGTCVGNLGANYLSSSTSTTTTTAPPTQCTFGTITATNGLAFGGYTVYSDLGISDSWTRILIKDSSGNTVESRVINQGDQVDFTNEGISVKILNVRARQDGTVIGVDAAVGNTGCYSQLQVATYPVEGIVAYNGTSPTVLASDTNGFIIQDYVDIPTLYISNSNTPYEKVYVLMGPQTSSGYYPVYVGGFDLTYARISIMPQNIYLLPSGGSTAIKVSLRSDFASSYSFLINITAPGESTSNFVGYFGNPVNNQFVLNYQNKTSLWTMTTPPSFGLADVQASVNGVFQSIISSSYVQTDSGWTFLGASDDNVNLLIPLYQTTAYHDVSTGLRAPCTLDGLSCGITVYSDQQFLSTGIVTNLGTFPENGNASFRTCSINAQPPLVVNGNYPVISCGATSTVPFQLDVSGSAKTQDFNFTTSLPPGYYRLDFFVNVTDDSNPTDDYSFVYIYVQPPLLNYTINFHQGWNLFSVPVSYVYNANSNCVPTSQIYGLYNGVYYQTTYVSGGNGYWVQISSDCQLNVSGNNISVNNFPYLNSGWNLIGAPSQQVTFTNVVGSCNVTQGPLWYDPSTNSYVSSTTLDPGKGYFLKVGQACQLGIGLPPPPPP